MKQQAETPLYATLLYNVREKLDITWNEYIYIDMVYHLSKDGWCYKSIENVASDMGMAKNGVIKMRDRLIKRGLLKKNIKGHVKTTVMYHSVVRSPEKTYHSVTKRTTQEYSDVPLSGTKNNIKNNKEKKDDNLRTQNPVFDDQAYAAARRKSEEIRRRLSSKLGLRPHA